MAEEDYFKTQLELEAAERQKAESSSGVSDPYIYTDPNDGTVYEWNHEKQAWFPKIDDDFIASYQANYQYQDDTTSKEETPVTQDADAQSEQANKMKRKANDPCWFNVDDAHNTNVYVSGLPPNTTEEEFIELMSKCGLIMKDPDTMKYKIKLYRNADRTLKGDGRCCYIKIESVGLALDILDGYLFKNKQIHVERAQFELKGTYDPAKKPRKKKNKEKEKLKRKLDKLFDWRPDKLWGERSRNEKTVVIKNMFDPKEFEENAPLILDYQKDLREECSKCGEVKKVVIYDRNPEGVVSVTFAEPEMADECVKMMNGRWFAARQLRAETWDGKTKYRVQETDEEKEKRLQEWESFLKGERKDEPSAVKNEKQDAVKADQSAHKKVEVSKSVYDAAGETESSGDSDSETDEKSVSSGNRDNINVKKTTNVGPVMSSSGSFAYPSTVTNNT